MKIVVCLKQVPTREWQPRVDDSGRWIRDADVSYELNEPDAYALEEALRLREKHGGEVVACSAGPARVQTVLREALARGADRAIHVDSDALAAADAAAIAATIEGALREEPFDLVLTGLQSDVQGHAQTGVVLAERLGIPHSTIIMQVEVLSGQVRVKRELEDGWFQHLQMPLPAVLTIQSGLNKLRYATLMGIKKAKTKELKVVTAAEVAQASAVIEKIYAPEKNKQGQIFDGDAKSAAAKLVEKLRFEARVL